jgi:hypothetical protein
MKKTRWTYGIDEERRNAQSKGPTIELIDNISPQDLEVDNDIAGALQILQYGDKHILNAVNLHSFMGMKEWMDEYTPGWKVAMEASRLLSKRQTISSLRYYIHFTCTSHALLYKLRFG